MRKLCLALVATLAIINPAAAYEVTQCFDLTIEDGKTYEFAVNEFGQVSPISVKSRGDDPTFVMRKTYLEPEEIGATGTFDSCEIAELFVKSAKEEVESAVNQFMESPFGKLFKSFGGAFGERDAAFGKMKLNKKSFYGKLCVTTPNGTEGCIESTDPDEFKRLKQEHAKQQQTEMMANLHKLLKDNPRMLKLFNKLEQVNKTKE